MDPDGRGNPARPFGRRRHLRVMAWAPRLTYGTRGSGATAAGGRAGDATPEAGAGHGDAPRRRQETPDVAPRTVTPPRIWRRAAWFAVAACCAVLTVLLFSAVRLAGDSYQRIDAFPGLPTGGLLTADPLGPPVHRPPAPTTTAASLASSSATHAGGPSGPGVAAAPGASVPGGSSPGRPARTAGPSAPAAATPTSSGGSSGGGGSSSGGSGGPQGPSAPPTVTVLPTGFVAAPMSAGELIASTRAFFDQLPKNIDGAWAMVGPGVQAQGYDAFRLQWDVAEVHLQGIVVNVDDSTVVATVGLLTNDGQDRVLQYRLAFRKSSTVVIEGITQVGGGGSLKPVK